MKKSTLLAILTCLLFMSCIDKNPMGTSINETSSENLMKTRSVQILGDCFIYARLTGLTKRLDIPNFSKEDGKKVQQYHCNLGDNQIFTFKDAGNGYVYIQCKNSGKYLDITSASNESGARLVQFRFNGNDNQKFMIEDLGNGYCRIKAKHSSKYLDVVSKSTSNGSEICQWHWNGGENQQFYIQKVNEVKCAWNFGTAGNILQGWSTDAVRIEAYASGLDHQAVDAFAIHYEGPGDDEWLTLSKTLTASEKSATVGAKYLTVMSNTEIYEVSRVTIDFSNGKTIQCEYGHMGLSNVHYLANDNSVTIDLRPHLTSDNTIENISVIENYTGYNLFNPGWINPYEYKHRINGVYIY